MKRWFYQLALWVNIVTVTVIMKGMLVWILKAPLARMGSFVLGPLEDNTKRHGHTLELVVVMMIIPFVLCAIQLWVQDSFLQSKKRGQGLHRFTDDELANTNRQYLQQRSYAQPLFSLSDAMWGPDSHRTYRVCSFAKSYSLCTSFFFTIPIKQVSEGRDKCEDEEQHDNTFTMEGVGRCGFPLSLSHPIFINFVHLLYRFQNTQTASRNG